MNCGCESGKRYEFHFDCVSCMARHYIEVLGGTTPFCRRYRKARYEQLKKAWAAERFAEWWKQVEALRNGVGRADDRAT